MGNVTEELHCPLVTVELVEDEAAPGTPLWSWLREEDERLEAEITSELEKPDFSAWMIREGQQSCFTPDV
jgi:hypothetical protein